MCWLTCKNLPNLEKDLYMTMVTMINEATILGTIVGPGGKGRQFVALTASFWLWALTTSSLYNYRSTHVNTSFSAAQSSDILHHIAKRCKFSIGFCTVPKGSLPISVTPMAGDSTLSFTSKHTDHIAMIIDHASF